MSASVLDMSMSLDGYIAGPNDGPGNPGGDDFMRLHDWYGFVAQPPSERRDGSRRGLGRYFLDEVRATGAVVSGLQHGGTGRPLGWRPPRRRPDLRAQPPAPQGRPWRSYPLVTYVTDGIASAMAQAKAAAGDRNVLVHGAYTAQTGARGGCPRRAADPPGPSVVR